MTLPTRASRHALAAALLIGLLHLPAVAGEAEARHGSWRDCLSRNFAPNAALGGRERAADAAFHACRNAEEAYLATLSASPLLDLDDIARARPALAGRIRAWLVGDRGAGD